MNTTQIPASMFRAALCCAAKGDVRYYINGIYLDGPAGRIVSTDGHVLFIGSVPVSTFRFIIPRDTVELAMKALGKKGVERTDIIVRDSDGYDLYTTAGTFQFVPIDGTFPEYDRIVPRAPSGKIAQFDPRLLARCCEAISWTLGRPACPVLVHNGDSAAIYRQAGADAFCLIMPWRADDGGSMHWYFGEQKAA